jgi:hypothetical protein
MLGWLHHIAIDIPMHSSSYNATRFLWPLADVRIDGTAWWRCTRRDRKLLTCAALTPAQPSPIGAGWTEELLRAHVPLPKDTKIGYVIR